MMKVITTLLLAFITVTCVSAQGGNSIQENCASDDSTASVQTQRSEPLNIELYFELPEFIEAGLASGSLERVGGVIRYSEDQQILAWLRQGGQVGQVVESSTSLLERIVFISGQQNATIGRVLGGTVPVLNIAMAGFGMVEHIIGIRAHEAELERIYDRVSEEFQRNREVELLAALDHAENALVAKCAEFKIEAVAHVTYELTIAQAQLVRDLDELLAVEVNKDNVAKFELATLYQVLAMKVCAMSTRLRLEIGEKEAALHWLSKCVESHRTFAEKIVRKWIGSRTAHYFHNTVTDDYFARYLDIERWLRGERDVLAALIARNRTHFWENEALDPIRVRGIGVQIDEDPIYKTAIPSAELLIENFQRLLGYELELKSTIMPFSEWDVLEEARIDSHDDYVMLVDVDLAQR